MMTLLLTSRCIYYFIFRFQDFNYNDTGSICNKELIFIYVEEIIFNFVIFYNLGKDFAVANLVVLKKDNEEEFEDQFDKSVMRINNTSNSRINFNNNSIVGSLVQSRLGGENSSKVNELHHSEQFEKV